MLLRWNLTQIEHFSRDRYAATASDPIRFAAYLKTKLFSGAKILEKLNSFFVSLRIFLDSLHRLLCFGKATSVKEFANNKREVQVVEELDSYWIWVLTHNVQKVLVEWLILHFVAPRLAQLLRNYSHHHH